MNRNLTTLALALSSLFPLACTGWSTGEDIDDSGKAAVHADLRAIAATLSPEMFAAKGSAGASSSGTPLAKAADGDCREGIKITEETVPYQAGGTVTHRDTVRLHDAQGRLTCDLTPPDYLGYEIASSLSTYPDKALWRTFKLDYSRPNRYSITGNGGMRYTLLAGFEGDLAHLEVLIDTLIMSWDNNDTAFHGLKEFRYDLALKGGEYKVSMALPKGVYRFIDNDEETDPTPADMVVLAGPIVRKGQKVGSLELTGPDRRIIVRDADGNMMGSR